MGRDPARGQGRKTLCTHLFQGSIEPGEDYFQR